MNAKQSREYIKHFCKYVCPGTDEVKFENGDTIKFKRMTDEQAIRVAGGLLAMEAEAAARRKNKDN